MKQSKNAIALLITLMFVIVITVAIGFGLKQVNSSAEIIKEEKFIYQSRVLVEDVLNILRSSKDIKKIADSNSSEELYLFLSQVAFIPLEYKDLKIVLKISSARAKFNPSMLESNNSLLMRHYLNKYGVNAQYIEVLADNFGGIKDDNSYNSRIFEENPSLFREYIATLAHLKVINEFYIKEYNENALLKIDFNSLFYFGADKNTSIDLNYASAEVWKLILGVSTERAEELLLGAGTYETKEDLDLSDEEAQNLELFKTDCFEPILLVEIELNESKNYSTISFEYDISTQKGSNFVFKI